VSLDYLLWQQTIYLDRSGLNCIMDLCGMWHFLHNHQIVVIHCSSGDNSSHGRNPIQVYDIKCKVMHDFVRFMIQALVEFQSGQYAET